MLSPARVPSDLTLDWKGELSRWAFLAAVATWIFHPFATSRMIGAGDALWYANMLADFVLQWREGIFPVFVGQTEYAFNGAIYPLRAAPLYQHFGGVLDLLTGRRLSFFALQHAIVVTVGVSAMISCYACLVAFRPRLRWVAALLTALYITCPGVLGVIFIQDLYMSWMALPFLPLVVFGMVRSYSNDDVRAWLAITAGLGGAWLAHAPIALWMTAIVGAAQLLRLTLINRAKGSWKRAIGGGVIFLVLAQYPFVSVYLLQGSGAAPAASSPLEHPERIVAALRAAFPGSILPLSTGAGELSDLQLGYGLGAALAIGIAAFLVKKQLELGVLLAIAIGIILILVPIPLWSETFWLKLVPEAVRRLTFYWPMHRLYLILATVAVFIAMLGLDSAAASRRNAARALAGILAIGCYWSLSETRQFQTAASQRTTTADDTARKQRPENRLLMTHAYGLFAKLPSYYSNGVMDPSAEFRLLDPATQEPLPATTAAVRQLVLEGDFSGSLDANPGILNLAPALILSPGKHYDLEFAFRPLNYAGVLQVVGTTFFREYALPASGEARAFGTVPPNSPVLPLWTSQSDPESISVRFIPTGPGLTPLDFTAFAHFRLYERSQSESPIQVQKWIPLTLAVKTPSPALAETPRMFTPGYEATSDGASVPLVVTPPGLTAIPVSAGASTIELRFRGPLLLHISYWTGLLAWTVLSAGCLYSRLSPRR